MALTSAPMPLHIRTRKTSTLARQSIEAPSPVHPEGPETEIQHAAMRHQRPHGASYREFQSWQRAL